MTPRLTVRIVLILLFALVGLAACGGTPATLADIPAYPDAVELKPGESNIADTLKNNNSADAAMRANTGVGGSTEQKGFNLPPKTTWNDVQSFYEQKLTAAGWSSNSLVSGMLQQVNQGNDLFQTANWQKNKQNVSIIMVASPTAPDDKQLIISLSSQ